MACHRVVTALKNPVHKLLINANLDFSGTDPLLPCIIPMKHKLSHSLSRVYHIDGEIALVTNNRKKSLT